MIGEILFIAFMLFIIFISLISGDDFEDKLKVIASCIVILVLGIFVNLNEGYVNTSEVTIVSLERGSEVSGGFVLGFGAVSSDVVYYAYEEVDTDTYVLRTFDSSRGNPIRLVETDEVRPHYKTTRTLECEKDGWFYDCETDIKMTYELFVPKGTIRKQFNG